MKNTDMYKNFRKFLKKLKSTDIDMTQKVEIKGYNWSLANGQFWAGDNKISQTDVELIYNFEGATPGSHNNAMYQALIFKGGAVGINGEGLNKRMDKLLKNKAEEIRNQIWFNHSTDF